MKNPNNMAMPENPVEAWSDPRYPVLFASGESVRLAKDVEQRLIEDAGRSGFEFRSIRTWDDYNNAVLVAASDEAAATERAAGAENLFTALLSSQN